MMILSLISVTYPLSAAFFFLLKGWIKSSFQISLHPRQWHCCALLKYCLQVLSIVCLIIWHVGFWNVCFLYLADISISKWSWCSASGIVCMYFYVCVCVCVKETCHGVNGVDMLELWLGNVSQTAFCPSMPNLKTWRKRELGITFIQSTKKGL